ncbi:MAG: TetR/AcrR family transcriptional regulator [Gemmatimonadaceae bacterium]
MTIPRIRPPRQVRSQETLHRILDAAERVLDEKSFTEATVAEIMIRAGVTVGAFYRRFPDKDALLHFLDERFFHEVGERGEALLDAERWRGASTADFLTEVARAAVDLYLSNRGVARSLFLRARVDPVVQATARRVNARFIERLQAVLLEPERRGELTHPDPERAIALGFMMFMAALRETTLFGEVWPNHREIVGGALADELARLYLSYLGAPLSPTVQRRANAWPPAPSPTDFNGQHDEGIGIGIAAVLVPDAGRRTTEPLVPLEPMTVLQHTPVVVGSSSEA